jgi:parallel beta helix pectate lyase-like protein
MRHQLSVAFPALLFALTISRVAGAEVIDCGGGDVGCLIAAINQANADARATTIRLTAGTFAIESGINGPTGLPSIVSTVTIDGGKEGATLTRAGDAPHFRFLEVGPSGTLTLNGIRFVDGNAGDPFNGSGGAILNDRGSLTIANCSFENNSAFGTGGAVHTNQGSMMVIDSAFTGNIAGAGGSAIFNTGGTVTITRTVFERNGSDAAALLSFDGNTRISESRFTANSSAFQAGGVFIRGGTAWVSQTTFERNGSQGVGGLIVEQGVLAVSDSAFVDNFGSVGGLENRGTATITNTTFARNRISGVFHSAIAFANRGTSTIINSTFVENRCASPGCGPPPADPASVIANINGTTVLQNDILVHSSEDGNVLDCTGTVSSLGNNLISDPTPCNMATQLSDRVGADARLSDLVDDGTPGNAHFELQPDSQAIDGANSAACPKKDQIGRPRTAHCDIGSIEFRRRPR